MRCTDAIFLYGAFNMGAVVVQIICKLLMVLTSYCTELTQAGALIKVVCTLAPAPTVHTRWKVISFTHYQERAVTSPITPSTRVVWARLTHHRPWNSESQAHEHAYIHHFVTQKMPGRLKAMSHEVTCSLLHSVFTGKGWSIDIFAHFHQQPYAHANAFLNSYAMYQQIVGQLFNVDAFPCVDTGNVVHAGEQKVDHASQHASSDYCDSHPCSFEGHHAAIYRQLKDTFSKLKEQLQVLLETGLLFTYT